MYIFQIFDYYAASRTLLFVGLAECIAISYVYGIKNYCRNLEKMWKFKLGPFLKFMWLFATPLFTLVCRRSNKLPRQWLNSINFAFISQILIFFTVMTYEDLSYNRTYKYPHWALRFGWLLSVSSVICIPVYALFKCLKTTGSFKEVCLTLVLFSQWFRSEL